MLGLGTCVGMNGRGYGMPSSHAQFAAYFATYLGLFLLVRHRPAASTTSPTSSTSPTKPSPSSSAPSHAATRRPTPPPPPPHRRHVLAALALALLALLVAASRVHLRYHTPAQVGVGTGAGAACGLAWFAAVGWARQRGLVEWGLETRLGEWVRARDLVCEVDEVEEGWRRWRERVRTRRREGKGKGM